MTPTEITITVIGLALLTLLTRAFFLLPERDLPLPHWLQQGLRYAPLAALMAVVAPEVVLTQGQLIHTWQDARLPAVAVASARKDGEPLEAVTPHVGSLAVSSPSR